MQINDSWKLMLCALVALQGSTGEGWGQTEEAPESVEPPLQITSDGVNRYEGGIYYAKDNVVVTYGGDVLMADEVHFNPQSKEATAKGNVRLYKLNQIYRGELLTYNFRTGSILSERFRLLDGKIMVEGESISTPQIGVCVVTDGNYSTDNSETLGWKVKTTTLTIHQKDKHISKNYDYLIGENNLTEFGEIPVFWSPLFLHSSEQGEGNFKFSPGSVSRLGVYARGAYEIPNSQKNGFGGGINLDYFGRRGWAGGGSVSYKTPPSTNGVINHNKPTEVALRGWYINDRGYQIYEGDAERPTNSAPPRGRYYFPYKHNTTIMKGGNPVDKDRAPDFDAPSLSSRSRVNVLSDAYVTQDFFAAEYIQDQQPNTYADVMYQDPNFTVTANARTQINNLFQTQQQKPSAKIEFKRQFIPGTYDKEDLFKNPDGNPGLAYEGESSVDNLGTQWNQVSNQTDYSALRYDTYHQLLYPRQYFNWLNLTPRAGIRGTVYTRSNLTTNGVAQNTQTGPTGNSQNLADTSLFRYVFNFGFDASTKAYATWNDVKNKAWAIDGIRHVFEPFVQASYVPQPNVRPTEFAGYDNRINTTESRPLNSTLYNSVDSIDKLLIVRPGMMNRILTKRDGAPYELANWKIYTDYQPIRPDLTSLNFSTVQAPETVPSSIPELYNVLNFMPVPWWTGTIGATTAISGNGFNSLNLGSRWQVMPALELGLGYSYLDGFNYLDALNNQDVTTTGAAQTSLINGSASYRLNESWFANAGVTYSVSPSLLQQVNVGLYRDIGAWILGGQVGNRQNNGAPSEFVALATLTLKAFPDLPLGFNQNPSSSGVGLGGSQPTAGTSP